MWKKGVRFCLAMLSLPILLWGHSNQTQALTLPEIDERIEALKQTLHEDYIEEMKDEVEGQGLMLADWEKYGQEMKKIKAKDEEVRQIRKQIQELEQQKTQLLHEQDLKSKSV